MFIRQFDNKRKKSVDFSYGTLPLTYLVAIHIKKSQLGFSILNDMEVPELKRSIGVWIYTIWRIWEGAMSKCNMNKRAMKRKNTMINETKHSEHDFL